MLFKAREYGRELSFVLPREKVQAFPQLFRQVIQRKPEKLRNDRRLCSFLYFSKILSDILQLKENGRRREFHCFLALTVGGVVIFGKIYILEEATAQSSS